MMEVGLKKQETAFCNLVGYPADKVFDTPFHIIILEFVRNVCIMGRRSSLGGRCE